MKTLALIIAFLALSSCGTPGGWQNYNSKDIAKDATIQKLLNFGLTTFLPPAVKENYLPASDWSINQVNSIQTQVVAGMNYKFDVDLTDPNGKIVNAIWVINYQPWNQQEKLVSWQVRQNSGHKVVEQEVESDPIYSSPNTPSGSLGGWKPASLDISQISDDLNLCLSTITKNEKGVSFTGSKITNVYLHFTKVVAGTMHQVTFRTENGQDVKIVQVTYVSQPWQKGDEKIAVNSYVIFDATTSFETITDPDVLAAMSKAAVASLEMLKPGVTCNIAPPLRGADTAVINGQAFFYLNAMAQGTDNSISHYEFWFNNPNPSTKVTSEQDLNLFAYAKLDINKEAMQRNGDLAKITVENGKVDCSSISSYFVCSVYSQCSSQAFIATSVCQPALTANSS